MRMDHHVPPKRPNKTIIIHCVRTQKAVLLYLLLADMAHICCWHAWPIFAVGTHGPYLLLARMAHTCYWHAWPMFAIGTHGHHISMVVLMPAR